MYVTTILEAFAVVYIINIILVKAQAALQVMENSIQDTKAFMQLAATNTTSTLKGMENSIQDTKAIMQLATTNTTATLKDIVENNAKLAAETSATTQRVKRYSQFIKDNREFIDNHKQKLETLEKNIPIHHPLLCCFGLETQS